MAIENMRELLMDDRSVVIESIKTILGKIDSLEAGNIADLKELIAAIRAVIKGTLYFNTGVANNEAEKDDEAPTLTKREKEIMQLISEGNTSNEIAAKLFLSIYTVDTHRKNLLTKFQVNNTARLIKMAAKLGIV